MKKWFRVYLGVSLGLIMAMTIAFLNLTGKKAASEHVKNESDPSINSKPVWCCPSESTMPKDGCDQIRYGRELIKNTSLYIGPKGSVSQTGNGMNCQNCHQQAGTKPWGNNYFAVHSTYPKFRERSGSVESAEKRVNDCLERSLQGKALPENSKEMKAITAYIKWLGTGVKKGEYPEGAGIADLDFLNCAASPEQGKLVYEQKCVSCHTQSGEGLMNADGKGFLYPPLWGKNSYTIAAGFYTISKLAGYIKHNMPQGASYKNTMLTDEEAWHVAAYINSMGHPVKSTEKDWPDISTKPFDYPFGPYADGFSESQHKFGPYEPIKKARETQKKKAG